MPDDEGRCFSKVFRRGTRRTQPAQPWLTKSGHYTF
jgi:hypothetical protein